MGSILPKLAGLKPTGSRDRSGSWEQHQVVAVHDLPLVRRAELAS
jgi:hypothetical protein